MSNQDMKYLFRPGDSGVPSYLASRKREQKIFRGCVKLLLNNRTPSQDLILFDPRGNGKTALLGYLKKETLKKEEPGMDVLWTTPSELEERRMKENDYFACDYKHFVAHGIEYDVVTSLSKVSM